MGCLAQASPEQVVEIEGVDLVVGTHQREDLLRLVESLPERDSQPVCVVMDDIFAVDEFEELPVSSFEGRTRGYPEDPRWMQPILLLLSRPLCAR